MKSAFKPFYISLAMVLLVHGDNLAVSQERNKVINPMKKRSREENLEMLRRMKERYPVIDLKLPTPTPAAPPTPTPTPLILETATPTRTPQPTNTPTLTPTLTPTATNTSKPPPRQVAKVAPKAAKVPTKTPTRTPTKTRTPTITPTKTPNYRATLRVIEKTDEDLTSVDSRTQFVLMLRIAEGVTWPKKNNSSVFTMCSMNPIDKDNKLDRLISLAKLKGKEIKLRSPSSPKQFKGCDLLLINSHERLSEILEIPGRESIFLIGTNPDYLKVGAMLAIFVGDNGKLEMKGSKEQMDRRGFKISEKLLKLMNR